MGSVVQFPPKHAAAPDPAETMLTRLAEAYRRRTRASEELPGLLADLAEAGETELVLQAILLWGHGHMESDEVMDLLAAGRLR